VRDRLSSSARRRRIAPPTSARCSAICRESKARMRNRRRPGADDLPRRVLQPGNGRSRHQPKVIVTKHRNGPVGTVKLLFEPPVHPLPQPWRRLNQGGTPVGTISWILLHLHDFGCFPGGAVFKLVATPPWDNQSMRRQQIKPTEKIPTNRKTVIRFAARDTPFVFLRTCFLRIICSPLFSVGPVIMVVALCPQPGNNSAPTPQQRHRSAEGNPALNIPPLRALWAVRVRPWPTARCSRSRAMGLRAC